MQPLPRVFVQSKSTAHVLTLICVLGLGTRFEPGHHFDFSHLVVLFYEAYRFLTGGGKAVEEKKKTMIDGDWSEVLTADPAARFILIHYSFIW